MCHTLGNLAHFSNFYLATSSPLAIKLAIERKRNIFLLLTMTQESSRLWCHNFNHEKFLGGDYIHSPQPRKFLGRGHQILKTFYQLSK